MEFVLDEAEGEEIFDAALCWCKRQEAKREMEELIFQLFVDIGGEG